MSPRLFQSGKLPAMALLGAVALGAAVNAGGQTSTPQPYLHHSWTSENGLPQNSINAIAQTRDGYLWLGTHGGLARFDGVSFTLFDTGNTPALRSSRIVALNEDRAGNLWIGTQYGGLSRYAQGRFVTWTTKDGLPNDGVLSLCEDRDGTLWIGTHNGLARMSGGRLTAFTSRFSGPVDQLWATSEGSVWFAGGGAVNRWRAGETTSYPTINSLPVGQVYGIREAPDESLWIAMDRGLFRFQDGAFSTILSYPVWTADRPPPELVFQIYADRERNLCFLTPRGVARVKAGRIVTAELAGLSSLVELTAEKLPRVFSVYEDREGNLWIGTGARGLHQFSLAPITAYSAEQGLANGSFVVITEDMQGGLWLGCGSGCGANGLFRFYAGKFTAYPFKSVWALHQSRDGSLWIGDDRGLHQFKQGHTTTFDSSNSALTGWPVAAIYEDRAGNLWVGTGRDSGIDGGLFRFHNGSFTPYRTSEGLIYNDVRSITQDRSGALWLGGTGGLSRFKDGRFTNYTTDQGLPNNYVRDIHETADGALWIATYGGGLSRLKDERFVNVTTSAGLFDNLISRILADERGNFWLSCNRGIFRASLKELNDLAEGRVRSINCVVYGVADGMKSSECNGSGQPAGWKSRDGRLWFPTKQGVVVIDPNRLNPLPPPVAIEQVLLGGQPVEAQGRVEAPPGRGDWEIHFTALSFTAPEKLRFRYRLAGYDREWIEAGGRRVAYYTNIAPGAYTFRVTACNNDGVWNEAGAALEFRLAPRFYQTTWFFALCLFTLGSAAWGGYRVRVNRLVSRAKMLEGKIAERTVEIVRQKNALGQSNAQLAQTNDQLTQANALLASANDDLHSILNQLRLGVAMTERDGVVTYLSLGAQDLLGKTSDEVLGRPWVEVLPLAATEQARLQALAELPPSRRVKLTVQLRAESGRDYWMEVEVQDDPRDPQRRIFLLYDVTEVYDLRSLLDEQAQFQGLVGRSMAMQFVYRQIRDVADVNATVLIEGETRTGKELVARAIHYSGARKQRPFIAINCAGLTESVLTSQLFGHKRGAFTGAVADHAGLFEAADGGTLFLDEIGELTLNLQANLLRVLQEKEITRLGENKPRRIDVRIIAATHRDLSRAVAEGTFRQDLFYRIRIVAIQLPPLRQRLEDLPVLAAWFIGQARGATGKPVQDLSREAMEVLLEHPWPGNVRELKNAIETAVIRARGPVIQTSDLPPEILGAVPEAARNGEPDEREQLLGALARARGNRTVAARLLGISRATLYRKLASLHINPDK